MSENEAVGSGPCVDDVADVAASLAGVTQGFAVNGNNLAVNRLAQALSPAHEAVLKTGGIEDRKDTGEGVVTRNSVRQWQEGGEPILFGLAEILHVIKRLAAAQQGANGDDQNVGEFVMPRAVDPGVRQFFEVVDQGELRLMRVWHPLQLCMYRNRTRTKCHTCRLFSSAFFDASALINILLHLRKTRA